MLLILTQTSPTIPLKLPQLQRTKIVQRFSSFCLVQTRLIVAAEKSSKVGFVGLIITNALVTKSKKKEKSLSYTCRAVNSAGIHLLS